jgi:hypothetical protein
MIVSLLWVLTFVGNPVSSSVFWAIFMADIFAVYHEDAVFGQVFTMISA